MPFPPRIDPREREDTPCISLRQLSKAGALTPGAVATLRWYEDAEGALVLVPEVQTPEDIAAGKGLEWYEPVFQAELRPWDGNNEAVPRGSRQPHLLTNGIELSYRLPSGEAVTRYARFIYSRAGFGRVPHLQCRTCDRPRDILCVSLFGGLLECPKCHGLDYRSQHRNGYERALMKRNRIFRKLGDTFLESEVWPAKPKWMRWPTYKRLIAQAERHDACYAEGRNRCRCLR